MVVKPHPKMPLYRKMNSYPGHHHVHSKQGWVIARASIVGTLLGSIRFRGPNNDEDARGVPQSRLHKPTLATIALRSTIG